MKNIISFLIILFLPPIADAVPANHLKEKTVRETTPPAKKPVLFHGARPKAHLQMPPKARYIPSKKGSSALNSSNMKKPAGKGAPGKTKKLVKPSPQRVSKPQRLTIVKKKECVSPRKSGHPAPALWNKTPRMEKKREAPFLAGRTSKPGTVAAVAPMGTYVSKVNLKPSLQKKSIAFFGASVTQQAKESGYIPQFKSLFKDEFDVHQFGYGGMQIDNAGICFIDKVLEVQPDIVFLEWSLQYGASNNNVKTAFEVIIKKILLSRSVPFVLHFPRISREQNTLIPSPSAPIFDEVSRVAGIKVLDLRSSFSIDDLKEMFRDGSHTNETGAKAYALSIKKFLDQQNFKDPINFSLAYKHPYEKVFKKAIDKEVYKGLQFKLNGCLIGIYQQIGPFSPMVSLKTTVAGGKAIKKKIMIWDHYCHYKRNTVKIQALELVNGLVEIKILNEDFDRSKCRRKVDWDWKTLTPKMVIHDIYYTGEMSDLEWIE